MDEERFELHRWRAGVMAREMCDTALWIGVEGEALGHIPMLELLDGLLLLVETCEWLGRHGGLR